VKQLLIYAGVGFAVFQVLLVMAVMAAAAKPTPKFEPEVQRKRRQPKVEEELELVS
jgi:hypothetical protein